MIAFGPIPSRRLGQSLGINNIPPKSCSYDCVYCQVGPTPVEEVARRSFYDPQEIFDSVRRKVEQIRDSGGQIDYLSFVPDGEPTLDIHLGEEIELLRVLGIKIAVITNGSILTSEEVRRELALADLVSIKVDSADEDSWQRINRPYKSLSLDSILEGALVFSKEFTGDIITETMLVRGINDDETSLKATAKFLEKLNPSVAYIAIPTRPPSEVWAQPPNEQTLLAAHQIFSARVDRTELLVGFPEDGFAISGDVIRDVLDITCVHPMRECEVFSFLERGGVNKRALEELVTNGKLVRVMHRGEWFYIRKLDLAGVKGKILTVDSA